MTAPKENPQPAGRHSLYRPEYCQQVEEQMGLGYSLGAFAGLIGVSRSTINEWMAAHPEFSEAVSRAKAKRLAKWELAAMKGAFTREGGNATLLIFGLKNAGRNPAGQEDEWAEKSEVKHAGAVGSYDLSKLSDDELKRLEAILSRAEISGSAGVPGGDSEA